MAIWNILVREWSDGKVSICWSSNTEQHSWKGFFKSHQLLNFFAKIKVTAKAITIPILKSKQRKWYFLRRVSHQEYSHWHGMLYWIYFQNRYSKIQHLKTLFLMLVSLEVRSPGSAKLSFDSQSLKGCSHRRTGVENMSCPSLRLLAEESVPQRLRLKYSWPSWQSGVVLWISGDIWVISWVSISLLLEFQES